MHTCRSLIDHCIFEKILRNEQKGIPQHDTINKVCWMSKMASVEWADVKANYIGHITLACSINSYFYAEKIEVLKNEIFLSYWQ